MVGTAGGPPSGTTVRVADGAGVFAYLGVILRCNVLMVNVQ